MEKAETVVLKILKDENRTAGTLSRKIKEQVRLYLPFKEFATCKITKMKCSKYMMLIIIIRRSPHKQTII